MVGSRQVVKKKIVIVGAGISGLAAARTFTSNGINDFIVLEAQSTPGGRIKSEDFGHCFLEHGAQWVHGSNSTIYEIAHENDLLSQIISQEGLGPYFLEHGEEIGMKIVNEVANEVGRILEDCEEFARNESDQFPKSVGDYLEEEFTNYLNGCQDPPKVTKIKKDLLGWHKRFQVIDNSCSNLKELSAKSWGNYKFCGGIDYQNFKHGYTTLVQSIVNDLPKGCLVLDCPVDKIYWKNICDNFDPSKDIGTCEIVCSNGTTYAANHVIVTCSIGYLKSHPDLFSPHLPLEYSVGLSSIGFDVINKIFLMYNERWWDKWVKGIQLVWDSNDEIDRSQEISWTRDLSGFDILANLPNILLGWVGGSGAEKMEQLTPYQVGVHCTQVLRQFTGRQDIPLPAMVVRSQWGSNKYIRGGYSHIRIDDPELSEDLHENLLRPITTKISSNIQHPTLLLAGEALSKAHFSTTHGAYEVGEEQANHLVQYLK